MSIGIILLILSVFFAGMEGKVLTHVSDLKPASSSLISTELSRSTQTSAEELSGLRQISIRSIVGQRPRLNRNLEAELILIMLAVLLTNTIFYKKQKRLRIRDDWNGKRVLICYIHHQDGRVH